MSRDDEDLRINTLYALTKRSPRVVLEEHSHCEVPAGCGGVVLRWLDPTLGVDGYLRVATLGQVAVWIDGAPVTNLWVQLSPGAHVIAVELVALPEEPSPFAFAFAPQTTEQPRPEIRPGRDWRWHGSPPEGWAAPETEVAAWAACKDGTTLYDALETNVGWRFRRIVESGIPPLRVMGPRVVLRGVLDVEPV
ncbi:MAG: hypothetical protein AAGA48_30640 [Myxococcota bacterium]